MRSAIKLPDVHDIIFVFQDSGLVVVDIKIIWSGKDGHHRWKLRCSCFAIHTVSADKD